jgi:hypothetical protein
MKNSALQLANQILIDNREFITGNVSEYMIQEVDANENNFYQYLTEEEIEEINGNPEKWKERGDEVYSMLKDNFNYNIEEFEY